MKTAMLYNKLRNGSRFTLKKSYKMLKTKAARNDDGGTRLAIDLCYEHQKKSYYRTCSFKRNSFLEGVGERGLEAGGY